MWQGIETAPVSSEHEGLGPRVLIFDPALSPDGSVGIGCYHKGTWYVQFPEQKGGVADGARWTPTHWMPLPEPPKVDWKPQEYDPADTGGAKPADSTAQQENTEAAE